MYNTLTESEDRFKLLVESVLDYAIFLLDPKGIIQSWNQGAERFKGYKANEVIGKHFSIFYTPVDIERNHPAYELQVASELGRFEEEGWRVRKDGTHFWANVVITRLTSHDGVIIGFAKVTRDLTQKKMAEEKLIESEERYRLLVTAVKDYAIFMLNPDGNVSTWNLGAETLKGYRSDEIIGKHFSLFYSVDDVKNRKPEWELREATLKGRFEDEGWRFRKDGSKLWANVIITAVRNDQDKLIGFTKVTRDMTERMKLEEELRRSNEELDQRVKQRTEQLEIALKARDEFISIVSHELRTPVTSLKLQVQIASRQAKNPDPKLFFEKTVKFIKGAERQLNRLSGLIDDILDVSIIALDKLVISKEEMDAHETLAEIISNFEEQASSYQTEIIYSLPNEIFLIKADKKRLEQVFSNLITNALKYGNGKPVKVRMQKKMYSLVLQVEDNGIGIAEEDKERIFGRFERAISSNVASGMGLGLYITQKIVEAHEGQITFESKVGVGSTFTLILPV